MRLWPITKTGSPGIWTRPGGGQPPRRRPTFIPKDVRLFLNSLDRSLTIMRSAGVNAGCARQDTEDEILLTIRIPKVRQAG